MASFALCAAAGAAAGAVGMAGTVVYCVGSVLNELENETIAAALLAQKTGIEAEINMKALASKLLATPPDRRFDTETLAGMTELRKASAVAKMGRSVNTTDGTILVNLSDQHCETLDGMRMHFCGDAALPHFCTKFLFRQPIDGPRVWAWTKWIQQPPNDE